MSSDRLIPADLGEAQLLANLDDHIADSTNPHAVKLAQLADLTNAGTGVPGQVPALQGDGTYLLTTPPGASGGASAGTAIPKIAGGTGSAGSAATASREDHIHPSGALSAADHGWLAWSFDPLIATANFALGAGTLYTVRVKVPASGTLTNIVVAISTAAAASTNAWVVVYDLAGTQLGVSADQTTGWNTGTTKTVPLITPVTGLSPGATVLVGVLVVGGTGPAVRCSVSAAGINLGIAASAGLRSGQLAGQTAPPSPLAVGSQANNGSVPLLAVT